MIRYKIDILMSMRERGITTRRLALDRIIDNKTQAKIRQGNTDISLRVLDNICSLLHCQPSDIIEWVPSPTNPVKLSADIDIDIDINNI